MNYPFLLPLYFPLNASEMIISQKVNYVLCLPLCRRHQAAPCMRGSHPVSVVWVTEEPLVISQRVPNEIPRDTHQGMAVLPNRSNQLLCLDTPSLTPGDHVMRTTSYCLGLSSIGYLSYFPSIQVFKIQY